MTTTRPTEVSLAALTPDRMLSAASLPPVRRPGHVERAARPRTRPRTGSGSALPVGGVAVLGRVVHAEVIKLLSVRSTLAALAIAAMFVVGLGAVMTAGVAFDVLPPMEEGEEALVAPLDAPMGGVGIALYAVAVLGVLAVSGEYSTRTVRSTIAAVPRRAVLVAGKAVAVAAVTLAVALPATLVAYVVGRVLLSAGGVQVDVTPGDAVRVVIGAALYLAVVALVGSGLAWLLRSTAGALAALIGLLLIVPAFAPVLPDGLRQGVAPFLPDAGTAVFQSAPLLAPWAGLAVFVAYAVVLLAAGTALITRRDS
jgi:ABC-2 type transport system permease protein